MCQVKEVFCLRNNCQIRYTGEEDHIFFSSQGLGIGQEVLHDFVGWLDYSRMSFTKFCEQHTNIYKSNNLASAAFVSVPTFIDLFFSWIVCLGFDYRDAVDHKCGYDADVMACDGTHIGVSIKNLKLDHPITEAEHQDQIHKVLFKINNRCFLPYPLKKKEIKWKVFNHKNSIVRDARQFLINQIIPVLSGETDLQAAQKDMTDEEKAADNDRRQALFNSGKQSLWESLEWAEVDGYREFLEDFLSRSSPSILKEQAQLLKLLIHENVAVITVLPFRFVDHLASCCAAGDSLTSDEFSEINIYCKEISNLLQAAQVHNKMDLVIPFLEGLISFVRKVHSHDRDVPDPQPIPSTYNPAEGTAYYFTQHGCKVRECPQYEVSTKIQGEEGTSCQKYFPQVSYGGFGYLFLFFCPYHGHCYGFHLVKGGEGPKDPFSALFKYKPSPPKEMFFDDACNFAEFALNREPGWFKWVRIWHDIFHGVNHVCLPLFHSKRVVGLGGLNSEICEQFNAYMKSIKFTGSSLSQVHFVLFTQFMILRWNRMKNQLCDDMESTSFQGLL